MPWLAAAYLVLLFVGTAVACGLAAFTWRQRRTAAFMTPLTVWLLAITVWCGSYLLFLISPDVASQVFWFKFKQVGSVLQAPSILIVTLALSGRLRWVTRRLLAALAAEVLVTWAIIATTDLHGLFWSGFQPNPSGTFPPLLEVRGPWASIRLFYATIVSVGAMLLLVLNLPRSSPPYRRQMLLLLLSSVFPWVGTLVTFTPVNPFRPLDLTPGGYSLLLTVWAAAIIRRRLFDIVPVARAAVIEDLQDAVLIVHAHGQLVDANPAALALLGRTAPSVLGQPVRDVLGHWPDVLAALRPGSPQSELVMEIGAPARSYEFRMIPWTEAGGPMSGWVIIARDVTARREVEELSVLHAIGSATSQSLLVTDVATALRQALKNGLNAPAGWVFLYDETSGLLRLQTSWGLTGDLAAAYQTVPVNSFTRPSALREQRAERYPAPFGGRREWRSALCVPLLAQGDVQGVAEVFSDQPTAFPHLRDTFFALLGREVGAAIRNARLHEQVDAGRQELQRLSQQLVDVQEAERRYVAAELHDEVGQYLTALRLTLSRIASPDDEASAAAVREADLLALNVLQKVRALSLDLRPAMLDDLGLLPALQWYLERYTAQTGITVDFRALGLDGRYPVAVETTAFRIVQEALTNVARHALVNSAVVRLWSDPQQITIQIEDEGAGFALPEKLGQGATSGVAGMRQRVRALGGRLTIESAPQQGTRIYAELPRRLADLPRPDRPDDNSRFLTG